MGNSPSEPKLSEAEEKSALDYDVSARAIADKIRVLAETKTAGVVVMAGAGISVSAGIPDFRSPGTGLYDNLAKYDLPRPEAIFSIDYFKEKPEAFCTLAKEMWPGNFAPTPTHFFLVLLERKGVLRRCFTQNIDTLEREAGVSPELLVEAHGSFAGAHCILCGSAHDCDGWLKQEILGGRVPKCKKCEEGLVKPDIVFFGESLPQKFAKCRSVDFPEAEVLLVMGTSLQVAPFCELMSECPPVCPRLLLNLNKVGDRKSGRYGAFRFNELDNYRDAALLMGCDQGVRLLCDHLGWRSELEELVDEYRRKNGCEGGGGGSGEKGAEEAADPTAPAPPPAPSPAAGATDALTRNWRRVPPVLPPLRPFDELGAAPPQGVCLSCALVEPKTLAEVVGGSPAWFRVGLHGDDGEGATADGASGVSAASGASGGPLSFEGRSRLGANLAAGEESGDEEGDYLALYPNGSTLTAEKTDRDFPFAGTLAPAAAALANDAKAHAEGPRVVELNEQGEEEQGLEEVSSPLPPRLAGLPYPPPFVGGRPLRLRVPWVRYELPFDMEVWYVDGATDQVLARWGPLTIAANGPDDPNEETHEASDMPDLDEDEMSQLVAALSQKFGMPPEMVKGMIQQKMMGDAGGDGGEEGGEEAAGGGEEEEEAEGGAQEAGQTAVASSDGEGSAGCGGAEQAASGASRPKNQQSGLAAGFAALKLAAGKSSSAAAEPVNVAASGKDGEGHTGGQEAAQGGASHQLPPVIASGENEFECD